MKYYLDGKLLFIDMRQKYTHAACMGDRVIACCHSAEEAENVCSALREKKRKFIDELLFALNSDEVYGRGGYQLTGDTAKRQHISDIKKNIVNKCADREDYPFEHYTAADYNKDVLAPEPYTEVYIRYLVYMIDVRAGNENQQISGADYKDAYNELAAFWTREHRPIPGKRCHSCCFGI